MSFIVYPEKKKKKKLSSYNELKIQTKDDHLEKNPGMTKERKGEDYFPVPASVS